MPPLYIEEDGNLLGFTEAFRLRMFMAGWKIVPNRQTVEYAPGKYRNCQADNYRLVPVDKSK